MSQHQRDLHQARADVVATGLLWRREQLAKSPRAADAQAEHEAAIDRLIRLRGGG